MPLAMEGVEQFLKESRQDRSDAITIVITGASSGIGLSAAKLLAKINPLNRIFLVCRTTNKAEYARDQVLSVLADCKSEQDVSYSENIIPLVCDHCSLFSVKQFIVDLRRKLDETYRREKWIYNGIDALCLNAGVLAAADSDPSFTQDGFETTFQTNHLSPFLIAHMTKGYINPGGRVILSTSGLHLRHKLELDGMVDPITGAVRKGFDMVNGKDYHYKDSYSMSKLCNVAVCAELNQILRDSNAISTCFSPGLMLESGLFRHQPLGEHPVPEPHRADVLRKAKSVDWGAGALAYMCWADEPGKVGAQYWRDESVQGNAAIYGQEFSPTPISEDTVDIKSRKLLWKFSCELAGVDCVQDGTYAYAVA